MDDLYLSEDVDLSGVYSTAQSVHITEGVSVIVCALMCSSYALCSSVFHNTDSEKCILVHGFHSPGDLLTSGDYWQYLRPAVIRYRVTITTGTAIAAATDATVFLTIIGSKGETNEFKIEDKTLFLFERGSVDTFIFQHVDVGKIEGIEIRHDNTGNYPGWDIVSVHIIKTGGISIDVEVNQSLGTTPLRLSKRQ